MKLEGGRISAFQLATYVLAVTIGSSLVLLPGGNAGRDRWIAILLGLAEGTLFVVFYMVLAMRFKGLSFVQICLEVLGPYAGNLAAIAYLWFLFHLGSLALINFSDFLTTSIMARTPPGVFLVGLMLVAAWAVAGGIEVIGRCAPVLTFPSIGIVMLTLPLFFLAVKPSNLVPILETPLPKLLWAAHGAATFPFAETAVFLMIVPYLAQRRNAPRAVLSGLVAGGLFLALIAARDIMVLGPTDAIYSYPSYQSTRLVSLGGFINRIEIGPALILLAMGFLNITAFYYGVVLGASQLLNLRTYRPLILPVGILMVILAMLNFSSFPEHPQFSFQAYPIYALIFELVIPALVFVVALIRGVPRKG